MAEITYDGAADALYIGFADRSGRVHTYSTEQHHDVNVDVVDGRVAGIEILGASTHPVFSRLLPRLSGGILTGYHEVTKDA